MRRYEQQRRLCYRVALSTHALQFLPLFIAIYRHGDVRSTCSWRYCRAIHPGFCVIEHRPFAITHGDNLLKAEHRRDSCGFSVNVPFANFTGGIFIEAWPMLLPGHVVPSLVSILFCQDSGFALLRWIAGLRQIRILSTSKVQGFFR